MATALVAPPKVITLGAVAVCLLGCGIAAGQAAMPGMQMPPSSVAGPAIQAAPGLVVRALVSEYDAETQTWTFSKGASATYGLTTVHADTLLVNTAPGQEFAQAKGHVELDDPVGMATADALNFSWLSTHRVATAQNVTIHIANVMVHAGHIEMKPTVWELYDVYITSCRDKPPLFGVHSRHMTIHPGSDGVLRKPTLQILGYNVVTTPDQTFNLNSRTQGLQYPNFSYHAGQGVGVSLKEGYLLAPNVNVAGSFSAIGQALPEYSGIVTDSLLPKSTPTSVITPASELTERFRYGYMDDINIGSPSQEARYLDTPRNSLSFASTWNGYVYDRPDTIAYTKPAEGIYEVGGRSGGIGYWGQARAQMIQEYREDFHERVILIGAVDLNPYKVRPNLDAIARLDTQLFAGNDFGWLRGEAGLAWKPIPQLTVAGVGYVSESSGRPLYSIDQLYGSNGFILRSDLNLGPTKVSYLVKWDTQLGWYDREYEIRQVVGCLEPFLLVRGFPHSYNLGIRLRLDEFYDALRRRNFQRPGTVGSDGTSPASVPPPMVISE